MDTKHKTISTTSAEVLKHFYDLDKLGFSSQEVFQLLKNSSRGSVKKLMRDMVKRGLLLRLKDGVFWTIPYEQEAAKYFPNWHLVANYIVGDTDYYIGYYSAMEIHNLITQPALREQIVVNKQFKPSSIKIKDYNFQYIYHNQKHFFGSTDIWIDSFNKVKCSDLEKTFIDCIYKPDYAGGITEIAKALYKAKGKIDYSKMFTYCKQFRAQSVIKRLGFLMELLNINNPIIEQLLELKTKSYVLLEPSYERKGKLISKWSIQQNIEPENITSPILT